MTIVSQVNEEHRFPLVELFDLDSYKEIEIDATIPAISLVPHFQQI